MGFLGVACEHVHLFDILLARAIKPIAESKKAKLSNLLESEKHHADDYGNKMVAVLLLQILYRTD